MGGRFERPCYLRLFDMGGSSVKAERNCLACVHCEFQRHEEPPWESGGGEDASLRCVKGHWGVGQFGDFPAVNLEGRWSSDSVKRDLKDHLDAAVDCEDYTPEDWAKGSK